MGASGDFALEMQKRALENKKRAPENRHRRRCKTLFNVADLVNGMWKVAPELFFFLGACMQYTYSWLFISQKHWTDKIASTSRIWIHGVLKTIEKGKADL